MSYYQLLNLKKEPFSSSPDPLFLYHSRECYNFLNKLEIAIRLRRGLNVLVGDIGTGKTTIGRSLLKLFEGETEDFLFHLILDPSFESGMEFLAFLLRTFSIPAPTESSPVAYKNALQFFLFEKGVKENKTIVLIIDEAQKLAPPALEVLREMLNFETNEYKLLQLVLLGQVELLEKIRQQPNVMDRINEYFVLHPMNRAETEAMINHRLAVAGPQNTPTLFTRGAINTIYRATGGYPRKIVFLCHHALITMLIQKKNRVDRATIRNVLKMRSNLRTKPMRFPAKRAFVAAALLLCLAVTLFFFIPRSSSLILFPLLKAQSLFSRAKNAVLAESIISTLTHYPSGSASSTAEPTLSTDVNMAPALSEAKVPANLIPESTQSTVDSFPRNISLLKEKIKVNHQKMDFLSTGTQALVRKESSRERTVTENPEPSSLLLRNSEFINFSPQPDRSLEKEISVKIIRVVKQGDTLSSLAHRIYGRSDPEVLRLIKLNNPGLTNINNLRI
ncbi:MAG: AAA family ATPase, partial [Deltaproteobacteria bacterium]|nr:AAA family ATPase [Deltaproteobacteria bacterium]